MPIKADVTYVHNVHLMRPFLPGKKIYVSHSNLEMEKRLNHRVAMQSVEAFRASLQIADEVFCVSKYEKELLLKTNGPAVKKKPIHIAYPGCNPIAVSSAEATRGAKAEADVGLGVYGYIGRLDFRKGLFNLIEDFPIHQRLMIATGGFGKYDRELYAMMALRLSKLEKKNIVAVGYCEGRRKENFFKNIRALIIPSLYEPFGLSALEGMQYQKPVIVAKTGGLCEIFGENHLLYFDPEDPKSLSKTIQVHEKLTESQRKHVIQYQNQRLQLFPVAAMLQTYQSMDPTFQRPAAGKK